MNTNIGSTKRTEIPPATGSSILKGKVISCKIEVDTTQLDAALDKLREMERIFDKLNL